MRRNALLLMVDVALIVLATLGALALRENFEVSSAKMAALLPYILATMVVSIPAGLIGGLNRVIWRLSGMRDYIRVIIVAIAIVILSVSIMFVINRLDGVARALPVLQGILMIVVLVGARVFIRQRHAHRSHARREATSMVPVAPQYPHETVLIVGLNRVAELYLEAVVSLAPDTTIIAGIIGRNDRQIGRLVQQQAVLGTPENVASVLRDLEVRGITVDRIVVTTRLDELSAEARNALLEIERSSTIHLDLFAERLRLDPDAKAVREVVSANGEGTSGGSGFSFSHTEIEAFQHRRYWRAKRLFDIGFASALIIVTVPFALLAALLVAVDVGLPVMFWQQRPGLGGRPFRLLKLRTMASPHDLTGRRIPDAMRLSAIGRFLRRTRLDELPQLYHILTGDMSFVGPRPLLPIDQPAAYCARLLVRPGLTGWAQIKGGREISARDKAALDVWYVCNASFSLDLAIIALTVPMIVFGERVDMASIERAWDELLQAGISVPNS